MTKKMNIAFIWHFHQPCYQEFENGDYLMPWVRLHASKDYLDMALRANDFNKIKLNFDISPVLLESIEKYSNGIMDIHLKLLLSDQNDLDEDDKVFILENFFDVNYTNMLSQREYYVSLNEKRVALSNYETREIINEFSNQEYADIMANFSLCWIDKKFLANYEDLNTLLNKEKKYTLSDRKRIYEIQLDIIKQIIPTYKKLQDDGKIEISTNPYYHAILPLLLNVEEEEYPYEENLPKKMHCGVEDAKEQVSRALDKFEDTFGKRPKGMWLSEQCASEKTIKLLSEFDVKWTVLDEGILSKTLKKDFERDFEGNLIDPFELCTNYKLKKNETNIIFSDSFFSHHISFGYGNYDPEVAANDLYEKIKTIQNKLIDSPKKKHLLTIAMDGENCWESYQNDGDEFLNILYSLIENDDTLQTTLVSDFISKSEPQTLNKLSSGSWINRNFNLWIGEPTKNLAWRYLNQTREDLDAIAKKLLQGAKGDSEKQEVEKLIENAKTEILMAQGSDWFWWYGEPNESGSDAIFDYLFREKLKNVYKNLGWSAPNHLNIPLISMVGKPIVQSSRYITPVIDGLETNKEEWEDAGYIFLPDTPTFSKNKNIKGIYYGCDSENLYFKFDITKDNLAEKGFFVHNQIHIYLRTQEHNYFSPVRPVSRTRHLYPTIRNNFSHEILLAYNKEDVWPPILNMAIPNGLWRNVLMSYQEYAYKDCLEMKISYKDLQIQEGTSVEFCVVSATGQIINEVYPQDVLLNINMG